MCATEFDPDVVHLNSIKSFNNNRVKYRNYEVGATLQSLNECSSKPKVCHFDLEFGVTSVQDIVHLNLLKPTGYVMHQQV
jgi:hypothetical protein